MLPFHQNISIIKIDEGAYGAFATKNYKINDKIYTLIGTAKNRNTQTAIQINPGSYVEDVIGRFINHKCFPNMILKDRTFFASRPIFRGEELTFDYRKTESNIMYPFVCNCCNKTIT